MRLMLFPGTSRRENLRHWILRKRIRSITAIDTVATAARNVKKAIRPCHRSRANLCPRGMRA